MAYKPREFKEEKIKRSRTDCAHCDHGFNIVETGDPMYPKAARPCQFCNKELGDSLRSEHLKKMATDSAYRSFEERAQERIRQARLEKLNPELANEVAEVFPKPPYVRPSLRSEVAAKKELAKRLYPDASHDLAFWENFDVAHPDPIKELGALYESESGGMIGENYDAATESTSGTGGKQGRKADQVDS